MLQQEQSKKRCYRCLLREMDQNAYFQNLRDYVEHLDDSIKASEELYEKRLEICKQCDYLQEGMCKACGCFVELRAAIQANVCSYSKW